MLKKSIRLSLFSPIFFLLFLLLLGQMSPVFAQEKGHQSGHGFMNMINKLLSLKRVADTEIRGSRGGACLEGTEEVDCSRLLRMKTPSGYPLTTREIDSYIHKLGLSLFPSSLSASDHITHQKKILVKVQGCEKQVFNDPRVRYEYRSHFNGKTGTMSNILTSGYFILYNSLLEKDPSIEVDAESDLKTIFSLVQHIPVKDGNLDMPEEERAALSAIIRKLKTKVGDHYSFLGGSWFKEYAEYVIDQHSKAMENWTYYRNGSERNLGTLLTWGKLDKKDPLFLKSAFEGFTHYEYMPPYLSNSNIFLSMDAGDVEKVTRYLGILGGFFNQE